MICSFEQLSATITRNDYEKKQEELRKKLHKHNVIDNQEHKGAVMNPINRSAAVMLKGAGAWCEPPEAYRKQERKGDKQMSKSSKYTEESGETLLPIRIGKQTVLPVKDGDGDYYDPDDFARAIIKYVQEEYRDSLGGLAMSVTEARGLIDEAVAGVGGQVKKYDDAMKDAKSKIRSSRMTVIAETHQVAKALKDVREFFLGSDYAEETKRLGEFVELCERLKALKECGFLDTVADTMINLAESK